MALPRVESEKRGRADIEKLGAGLWEPWLDWGQQTCTRSTKGPILPAVCAPGPSTPPQGGKQKPLPEHAGPTRWVAEAGASQGSQRELVSRQEKAFRLFATTLSKNTTLPPLIS